MELNSLAMAFLCKIVYNLRYLKTHLNLRIRIILISAAVAGFLTAALTVIMIGVTGRISYNILSETMPPAAENAALVIRGHLFNYETFGNVLENISIPPGGMVYIIDKDGTILAYRDKNQPRYGDYLFSGYTAGPGLNEAIEILQTGQGGFVRLGSGLRRSFYSFVPIAGTEWTLVKAAPRRHFPQIFPDGIVSGISITMITFAAFCLLSNFLIGHFFVRPLKTVSENIQTMSCSMESVIGEIEKTAHAVSCGRLNKRADLSSMEGDFYRIVSAVNNALDAACSHLNTIPMPLALFNEEREMIYPNEAMCNFLLKHDLDENNLELLEYITGSGSLNIQALNPRAAAVFDPAIVSPEPFLTDIAMLSHDGASNFVLTIQRSGRKTQLDGLSCVMLLLNDVTMLTRAKIDAEAASRTKSDFLSRMSHEIRTPMNAVIGMIQIAKGTDNMGRIRSCLEQIGNSSNHLLGVINDILDFSKMESGKILLDISEFSLTENLDFVVSMMRPKAREKSIRIRVLTESIQNDAISADSLRLNQVLINLLSNAIKFSPDGSDVLLSVRELGSESGYSSYSFEVADRGIGISEFQASKLFRPFEQADDSISRNYGGTGLGLTISKTLVEMMGGKISLKSKEGKGSKFSFTIHCAARPSIEKKVSGELFPLNGNNYDFSEKRCLVVDDIEINREIIIELLSSTNLHFESAENGQEAVDKFLSSPDGYFDIILMDMQMPVMDGCSATREIRRLENERAVKGIPIVAMTANVMQEDIKKALDAGMDAHLGKPIELELTLKTIQEQLTKSKT